MAFFIFIIPFPNQEHGFLWGKVWFFSFFLIPESDLQSSLQIQTTPCSFAINLSPLQLSNSPLKPMCNTQIALWAYRGLTRGEQPGRSTIWCHELSPETWKFISHHWPYTVILSIILIFEGAGECYVKLRKLQHFIGQKYPGALVFNVTSLDKNQFPFSNPGNGCL